MTRALRKATAAQRQRLSEISNGWRTRSGRYLDSYYMHNANTPTAPLVDLLIANGWITWTDNKAELTADGLVAMKGGAA